jgi:dihydroflavonol-4-reductase
VSDRTAKSVLVTGGAGFVGSHLVRSYLNSGIAVRVVGHLKQGCLDQRWNISTALELFDLDLCDLPATVDAFAGQALVIHTAAKIRANTPDERMLQKRVNVDATRNVIEACRRNAIPRLLHVSTTAAIGISQKPTMPADEGFRFNLDHLDLSYNLTKHQAEQLVLAANGSDLETVVVNPGFVFGPHQEGYRGREVIERVLRSSVVMCTDGGLSVVHVDDVVDGIRRAAVNGRPGQRYILSGENLSFREIADTVCRISARRRIVISVPNVVRNLAGLYASSRLAQARDRGPHLHLNRHYAYQYYSSEKARLELGYQPRSFAKIVAEALDYIPDSELNQTRAEQ